MGEVLILYEYERGEIYSPISQIIPEQGMNFDDTLESQPSEKI